MKATVRKQSGLCITCDDGVSCNYPKSHKQPVVQCEEFSCAPTPSNKKEDKSSRMNNADKKEKNNNNFKGLCANCENNENCTIDKPEGGIWHCEEYR